MSVIKSVICFLFPRPIIDQMLIFKNRTLVIWANIKFKCSLNRKNRLDYYSIPIIINNFNRLTFLCKLILSLEKKGYKNIHIIDNASTYPPLLEYYKTCPYTIYRLNQNIGYKAIWETGIYEKFKHDYYVYTDSDMQIDDNCPDDFMEYFVTILKKYPVCQKVGFGIRIDDIPDSYEYKNKVIEWESQFWRNEVRPGLYRASIDTTFALYRPYCKGEASVYQKVFRTGFPYVIRHLPWYNLEECQAEEDYYLSTISTSTHWSNQKKSVNK